MAWKDTEGRLWLVVLAEQEKPGGGSWTMAARGVREDAAATSVSLRWGKTPAAEDK